MNIGAVTTGSVTTAVWAAATRSLTTEANTKTAIGAISQSVLAGAIADLRPAAGVFRHLTIDVDVATTFALSVYDGTTFPQTQNQAIGVYSGVGNATRGLSVKNTSAGAANLDYCGYDQI